MKLKTSALFVILSTVSVVSCQLPFAQSIYVKRDRFGESPVQDMRNGKSYMEWRYDEDTRHAVQAHLEREEAEQQRLLKEQKNAKKEKSEGSSEPAEESWFSGLFD